MDKEKKKQKPEVRVCGVGKQRVININPLLLTPSSAVRFHKPGQRKPNHPTKAVSGFSSFPGLAKPKVSGSYSSLQSLQDEDLPDSETSGSEKDPALSFYTHSLSLENATNFRRSSTNLSIAESDLSLSSVVTTATDDLNSITDSEATDISAFVTHSDSPNQLSDFKPPPGESQSYLRSTLSAGINDNALNFSTSQQTAAHYPKSRSNNFDSPAKINETMNNLQSDSSAKKQSRILAPRRERIIEISPTLMLPVTTVGSSWDSYNERLSGDDIASRFNADTIHVTNNHQIQQQDLIDNEETLEVTVLTEARHDTIASDVHFEKNAQDDSIGVECRDDAIMKLQTECESLRQSLKLSDADIAILVSSKQQLQLEFHDEKERNKVLSKQHRELENTNQENLLQLKKYEKEIEDTDDLHKKEISEKLREISKISEKLNATENFLDVTRKEKESTKQKLEDADYNVESSAMKIRKLEDELLEVTRKNLSLEASVEDAIAKGSGNTEYLSYLKEETNALAMKLQEKEHDNQVHEIKNKVQETKIVDLQHEVKTLSEKLSKATSKADDYSKENKTLRTDLQAASKEKAELNSAVSRLRADLQKVETSFTRLKKQMIEKSQLAVNELSQRKNLEEQVQILSERESKFNQLNAETRINDKNIQIQQVLAKMRILEAKKVDLELAMSALQSSLNAKEKSWVQAVEREQETARLLTEKQRQYDEVKREYEQFSNTVKMKHKDFDSLAQSLKESELRSEELKDEMGETAQNYIEEKKNMVAAIQELESELQLRKQKFENEASAHIEKMFRLKHSNAELNLQVEKLQLDLLSKDDELKNKKSSRADSVESDVASIHHMELLSELQSARRTLLQEKENFLQEKQSSASKLESMKNKVTEINAAWNQSKKDEEIKLEEIKRQSEKTIRDLEQVILEKDEKIFANNQVRNILEEEMVVVRDHNDVLSQQLGALQVHSHKLSDDLQTKIEELEEFETQCKMLEEEVKIAKSELSNVTLKLADALHNNEDLAKNNTMEGTENLIKERDRLRDAVMRQQQYAASLQKHYEKWARDAGNKMKEEISKVRIIAEAEHQRLSQERAEQQNIILMMENKIKRSSPDENRNSSDASTQTSHNETPICLMSNIQHSQSDSPHIDETNTVSTWTQTDHNDHVVHNDYLVKSHDMKKLQEELTSTRQVLSNTQSQLKFALEKAELLESDLREKASLGKGRYSDNSTQTSHSKTLLCLLSKDEELIVENTGSIFNKKGLIPQSVDSWTQTDHNLQPVTPCKWLTPNEETDRSIVEAESPHRIHAVDVHSEDFSLIPSDILFSPSSCNDDGLTSSITDNATLYKHCTSPMPTNKKISGSPIDQCYEKKKIDADTQTFFSKETTSFVSIGVQTDANDNVNPVSLVCVKCGQSVGNEYNDNITSQPPSPMTILKTMESKKLKAYKKTVNLLKKKLSEADIHISDLQAQIMALTPRSNSSDSDGNRVIIRSEILETEKNDKYLEEIKLLQNELCSLKKSSALQAEEARRKSLCQKKKFESKLTEMMERVSRLTDTNRQLRESVQNLQVKLAERTRSGELAMREKQRYQLRARRLQASLHSLAWISKKDDSMSSFECSLDNKDEIPDKRLQQNYEIVDLMSSGDARKKANSTSSVLNLPASVHEIEESLKDLQSEIIALEKQMQEHNSAVKRSKNNWRKIKEETTLTARSGEGYIDGSVSLRNEYNDPISPIEAQNEKSDIDIFEVV